MTPRRRDNTPPYEIMGQQPIKPQASGRGPRPGGGGLSGVGGLGRSVLDAWREGAREPWLLRVPRGVAVCLLAGLLGLLVLAYWVGYSRGGSAAEKRVTEFYEPQLNGSGRVPPTRPGASPGTESRGYGGPGGLGGPGAPAAAAGSTGALDPGRADSRVPGLNYLILALYPPKEARRLQAFLAERQVEVMVGPRNNKGLCQVIALTGFTREQIRDTDAETRFMARLRALGRDWKASNKGKGDDLSSMYYDKYDPPG